ncbi:hypothetical protein [Nannocystis pusilla]
MNDFTEVVDEEQAMKDAEKMLSDPSRWMTSSARSRRSSRWAA